MYVRRCEHVERVVSMVIWRVVDFEQARGIGVNKVLEE